MKITKIELTHHAIDLDPPFPASWDPVPRRRFVVDIVRVATDEGLVGIGSGDPMPGLAGNEHLFIGHDPRDLSRHARIIDNLSFFYGRIWPLDLALWDLFGKITGQPVWRLLGGSSGRILCYASSGTLRDPGAMAEQAAAFAERGYRHMKIRFHEEHWRKDVAKIEAVRTAIGDRMELMVDCNQGWRMPWDASPSWTLKDALAVAKALEPLGVFWLEEPLHRSDVQGMKALRDATPIRVAAGELARDLESMRTFIRAGCVDVLQTDVVCGGGISGLADVFREARAAGIAFTPHTWGNGIGLLGNAHLVAGLGPMLPLEFPYDPPEWTTARRDHGLARTIEVDGQACMNLDETPGLGIELDEDKLAATRIG
ncbi:MAG TPA: mandelate racemase/muconate lactonizing enzyme family protein [Geminicoccus sp.]|jgi:L-alanine-DL-glutamate epimerase-like enolase superfamily enzyme|uniref:mandelate racemase/muconate lactonizing enzyme family protein n=1 Tax=Geminicoccus sp. TaxID=2024832 RepID=UPI002E326F65|nr:mandelate racemase/muconate lactonizing enzyme family protein [Geminicoccus sp.]HEX2525772.1 mandelate racemase/muconate lactonizing enzyme family protein [Geminicoccus sp.]